MSQIGRRVAETIRLARATGWRMLLIPFSAAVSWSCLFGTVRKSAMGAADLESLSISRPVEPRLCNLNSCYSGLTSCCVHARMPDQWPTLEADGCGERESARTGGHLDFEFEHTLAGGIPLM